MKKQYKNIIITDSIYSLLLFLLYIGDSKDNLYISTTRIDNDIFSNLIGDKIIFSNKFVIKLKREKNTFKRILHAISHKIYIRTKIPSFSIFNFEKIYVQDISFFDRYLLNQHKYTIIEDGYGNYENIHYFENNEQQLKKLTFKRVRSWGLSKNCGKIILTGIGYIPKSITKKVELIDIKTLWKKSNSQNDILRIFNINENLINSLTKKSTILLTQPFSENHVLTEAEKIEVYKKCVDVNYSDLIIKTHPDETTDYNKYFEGATVITQLFPFEILGLLDIKFKKTITLFSTAALSFKDDSEIVWCGSEVHPKLLEKYGHQPML